MYTFNKSEVDNRMKTALASLEHNLASVRTGRASPVLLENVRVDAHGSKMQLKELAGVSVLDNFTLSVKPWDSSMSGLIASSIQNANLGVTAIAEGSIVRVVFPKMTEERRKEMAKIVHHIGEDSKVAVRNIRRDENDKIKAAEKAKEISKDDMHRFEEEVQKVLDKTIEKIDADIKNKTHEVMEV